MSSSKRRSRRTAPTGDPRRLLHALEVHEAELEAQNGALVAANDELRRSNDALVVAQERFRALYDRAPTPYVTLDASRTIVDVNRAAEAILGTARAGLIGGTIDVFLDDAARARFRTFVDEVFAAGHARGDVIIAGAGGAQVDALIDGVVLREGVDGPPRCALAIVDVTSRKLAETARRRAQDEVLAIVSHDLRGPLHAIGLSCDLLSTELTPDEHRTCVTSIERSVARSERLIEDLLHVAQIESGRLSLELAPVDLSELVRQVCRDHELAAAVARSKLTASVPERPLLMIGDADRLHQVLSNLIRNALNHARGAPIEVSAVPRGAELVIVVADQGPGIPDDELPLVFEKYRQGARRRGGAGLGLAIVKGLVEAHRGAAAVTSQLGRGARFEIVLPRGDPPASTSA